MITVAATGRHQLPSTRVTTPPVVDGRLDEAIWHEAPVATDFTQQRPNSGRPSRFRTEARVLYDSRNLYVGIHAFDPAPDSIARQLSRRDVDEIYADYVWVSFDTYNDRRTAFSFGTSAAGAQQDVFHFNDTQDDNLWDAVWESKVHRDSTGWTAEFRIPLSQLRFTIPPDGGALSWGINFGREVARDGETSFWREVPADQPAYVSRFGDLTGLTGLQSPGRLELLPYARSQVTTQSGIPAGDPFTRDVKPAQAVGVDFRYRLPAGLTLTGALNPDFGQVEADPAVVNLTQFEVFFPERRPFFLEGADIFSFGRTLTLNDNSSNIFFYTRRVGRAPRRRFGDALFADIPRQTPILGSAKVSGKTDGGLSVGVLAAVTSQESGRWLDTLGNVRRDMVEPRSEQVVARLRQDFRDGNTVVGSFTSYVNRELTDDALRPLMPNRALVGGLDFEHAWDSRTWAISGLWATTRSDGDTRFIRGLQRAAPRLFQRPDAPWLGVDSAATQLTGSYAALSFAKLAGKRWLGSVTLEQTTPGFDLNELGFGTRADFRTFSTLLSYRNPSQSRWFREYSVGTGTTASWNFGGDKIEERHALFGEALTNNFISLGFDGFYSPSYGDDRTTRGGVLTQLPAFWRLSGRVRSDSRKPVIAALSLGWRADASGKSITSAGVELDVRPVPALRLRVSPQLDLRFDNAQWVANAADPTATGTAGIRTVLGEVRQNELSITTRVDWTFTPYLSLQMVAQPFISAGQFERFTWLRQRGTFDRGTFGANGSTVVRSAGAVTVDADGAGPATPVTFGDPDFTVRAMRGNAVLRWEYAPGCTVFFVWQQQREGFDPTAQLALGQQLFDVYRDRMTNVFLIKATYWIGP